MDRCGMEGCRVSSSEHHLVNVGLVSENASLKAAARRNDVDLSHISTDDLLSELRSRIEG